MQVLPRFCAKDALGRVRASAPASKLSTVANFITELFIAVSFFFIFVRSQGEMHIAWRRRAGLFAGRATG